jgi:hypothetical protein
MQIVYCDGIPTDEDVIQIKKIKARHLVVLVPSSLDQKEVTAYTLGLLELNGYKATVDCVCVDMEKWDFEQAQAIVNKQMGRLVETGVIRTDLNNITTKDIGISKWEQQLWAITLECIAKTSKPVAFKRETSNRGEAETVVFYTTEGNSDNVTEIVDQLKSVERIVEGLSWPGVEIQVFDTLSLDFQYTDKLILVCKELVEGSIHEDNIRYRTGEGNKETNTEST